MQKLKYITINLSRSRLLERQYFMVTLSGYVARIIVT